MPILLFAENTNGTFKKPVLEAATYAYHLAQKSGTSLAAVSVGQVENAELEKLGAYGVSQVYTIADADAAGFANMAFASAVSKVAKNIEATAVVMAQTYNGRAIAPRVAVKIKAAPLSGISTLADPANGYKSERIAFSSKGVQTLSTPSDKVVITVKTNGYHIEENPTDVAIEQVDMSLNASMDGLLKEVVKASEGISLTEAENVVAAGRGMKGPENWGMIEELATLIGAATACSKPTADMGWRPHHEHVGQTGIQISPNLYIAIGISGAIQHLAGVSSSKNIVVINKDPEAPFFKIADYGIVGDLFDVVPRMLEAIKAARAAA